MEIKKTVNQLLDLIDSLPAQSHKDNKEVEKLRQTLLKIKHSPEYNGYGGNVVLENSEELLKMIKK